MPRRKTPDAPPTHAPKRPTPPATIPGYLAERLDEGFTVIRPRAARTRLADAIAPPRQELLGSALLERHPGASPGAHDGAHEGQDHDPKQHG